MKILLAPDKFKGSLTARQVSQAMANGIQRFDASIETVLHPMADGGEGSLEVLEQLLKPERITLEVPDPLFRPVRASYLWKDQRAYVEMAQASGLELLAPAERNCLYTTTLGTGSLMADALDRGATELYLFIGGSATNDAGLGVARALGYRFLDEDNQEIEPIGKELVRLAAIDTSQLRYDFSQVKVYVVCDVQNVLYGPAGAAYVYGPQKGADAAALRVLDDGLRQVSRVVQADLGITLNNLAGGGAAGGVGAGAVAFLGAEILPGTDTLMQITQFYEQLAEVDLIMTGEGKLDEQTLHGKLVQGVVQAGRQRGIPVAAICGTCTVDKALLYEAGLRQVAEVLPRCKTLQEAMTQAGPVVEELAYEIIKTFRSVGT
ncbi:glycerate kinase [Rhabdobacter roseus]|uniref:Glycerate kinase n=1 Tax=Rhabdobacter roseus TaxID=1655419 RepID=A0A840TNC6_9BACT|nr:glycerate kinase [Rhabdobacter roseus]MBB5285191.1 glycerate kinase [Rhabdobacter roseus]